MARRDRDLHARTGGTPHTTPLSPLSTLGALCAAAVADVAEARVLFRQLLIWGLSMSIVGTILCQTLAGVFARA